MPKNMGKGGKSFKAGNAKGDSGKRELTYADEESGEKYAMVKSALGNLRLQCQLVDGEVVIGVIRGAMVRKQWITKGDVVIIAVREFNEHDNVDIVYKYKPDEVRALVKEGLIPRDFRGAEDGQSEQQHDSIDFVLDVEEQTKDEKKSKYDRTQLVVDDPLAALEGGDENEDEDIDDL